MTQDGCSPNNITYSCLISACERGGQFDRALDWYQRMQSSGVQADGIIYRCAVPVAAGGAECLSFAVPRTSFSASVCSRIPVPPPASAGPGEGAAGCQSSSSASAGICTWP